MLNLRLALLGAAVLAAAASVGASAASRARLGRAVGSDAAWWGLTAFTVGARAGWLLMNPAGPGYPLDAVRITQGLYAPAGVAAAAVALGLLARQRAVSWRALAPTATAAAFAAAAAWHATCALQSRCGGKPAPWPVGWAMGGASPQVPVAPVLALLAAALAWWLWRRPDELSARRALLCSSAYLAVLAASGSVALRLAAWPSAGDVGFAAVALALAVLAVASRPWRAAAPVPQPSADTGDRARGEPEHGGAAETA